MTSRRPLLFRFRWPRTTIAGLWGAYLACVLFLTGPLHALDPNKRITQYLHNSWRAEQDNIHPGGYKITQTSDGFLWVVSGDMHTFDGVRFVPWDGPPNYGSISTHDTGFGQIVNAFADHAGGLWVFGLRGIVHLKGRIVTSQFQLDGLRSLQIISEDPDGSLWVVRGSNTISDQPLCHVTDHAVRCFGKADGIPISPVNSILADGKGGFWLGGQTALVHWHSGVSESYPIEGLKSNAGRTGIGSLALGPDGSLWAGTFRGGPRRGLGRLIKGVFQPFITPGFDGSKLSVCSMIFDRDGNLWVGTEGQGIFRIQGTLVDHYGRAEGLSSDTVSAVFEDREGILWAAAPDGIDNFRDPQVTSFSASEGLGDRPMGVLAGRDGAIWVASTGSLDRIEKNGAISSIRARDGLPGSQVASMLEDRAGNMWVGVDDGLYLFENGRFRRLPEPDHKPIGLVVGMAEDIDGNIWAECAGNPGKLVRIRDFQVREEFPASQVPTGRTLAPDPQGGIWIGTLKGDLAFFRHGAVETFTLNAKGDPFIRQIIANADGSVLAGSADGLVGVRQGKMQRMTTKNGLPCNFVTSFIQDREKRWWLYTDCGIVELPDSELQRWWTNPQAIVQTHVYDELDGAQAGRPDYNSAALSSDGRVWFASGVWVQMVDPSRVSQKALPAATTIESVTVDRTELQATNNLRISPHPRDLQIDYTSPTFLIPQRVNFRYWLDGYDREWHEAGTRRQAFYTDLPPGKYSFRVIACNSDGVWNESAAKLDFYVVPAYYQTNWFRALCVVLLLALLWAGYQFRVRQLRHQFAMTLEARVGERTRIARDLHDTLLQSFHGLLLRFQTVSQLLPDRSIEAKEKLNSTIEQAADAITKGRDAVQGLRDSTVQSNDLARAINTLGDELTADPAQQRPPAFRVTVEGETRNLHPIVRDEIYKIASEALRNAFRHAQARHLEVEIRYDDQQFRLRVRDDGKGIASAVLSGQVPEGHFGLNGMRERAKLIGGTLVVRSEVDVRTEVELRLPAVRAYTAPRRGAWFARTFAGKAKD
ncbi:MAG TPA: two-component regulator propeller domain-containing protein [Terracidiphilus sp.]|nr:two-component regulator propeller domain-containing protein [Terracidiphilus sp.]